MLITPIAELGRVADIDDAKGFVVLAKTQRNFAVAAGQVVSVQGGDGGRVEHIFQNTTVRLSFF